MDDIMEELLDVFEEWCNECIDLEEIPLDFQRSDDDMGTYKELATEVFWMGWLGGYGCGFEHGVALDRRQDAIIH